MLFCILVIWSLNPHDTNLSLLLHFCRYFHHHGYDQGPNSRTCPTCYRYRPLSSNWTSGQAKKGLHLKGLNDVLFSRRYPHSSLTTSGWCKGVELYDDETMTSAALDGYGSVWELDRGLAM